MPTPQKMAKKRLFDQFLDQDHFNPKERFYPTLQAIRAKKVMWRERFIYIFFMVMGLRPMQILGSEIKTFWAQNRAIL